MIVWLNVPFSEKDAAKRLGARWSPGNKKWYVQNVENLAPFLRWMDDRMKQPAKRKAKPASPPAGGNADRNEKAAAGITITGAQYVDDGIERDWPPWEDGPNAVENEFSDEAIGEKLRSL